MHVAFIDYLVDPSTKAPLTIEIRERVGDRILEGNLISPTAKYPIVRGVPRFAGYAERRSTSRTFGYQWQRWPRVNFESASVGTPMEGYTRNMWERIVSVFADDLHGAVIADFGCGSGRFIEIVRMKQGRVIGVDISDAVEAARRNFEHDPNVLICQADVLNPPIRPESVDGAFSIGVLHHTPEPRRGLLEMVKTVKRGGWVAVSVYGKGGYYDFPTVRAYRRLFNMLWTVCGPYPVLAYSYLAAYVLRPFSHVPGLGLLIRALFPFARLRTAKWSLLDTFDSLTPRYQSAHESYEVFRWCVEAGLSDIAPSDWGFTTYHGVRG
jgi:SAM-dependent methyltransferase